MKMMLVIMTLFLPACVTNHRVKNDFCKSELKSITFHKAYPAKPKGWHDASKHNNLIYSLNEEIDNSEILSLKRSSEGRFIEGELTDQGKQKFSTLTKELAEKKGYLLIKLAGKVIADPKVQAEISSGRFHIFLMDGLKTSDFCR